MSDNSDSDDCVDQYFTSYGDLEVTIKTALNFNICFYFYYLNNTLF